jgi:carbamoyltransferase
MPNNPKKPVFILGISAFYHDSAACILRDGEIVAAAQEERFTRLKHDPSFPENAVAFCLEHEGLSIGDVDVVAFYDKPFLKFERILETCQEYAPRGLKSFLAAMPPWLDKKLMMKKTIRTALSPEGGLAAPILFPEHHLSHAASAFFPSPFRDAAIVTIDGVGEYATTTIARGEGGGIRMLMDIGFPHSLGLLYSAFTYYTGFRVNSGEYKLMGLAPFGEPVYKDLIYDRLIRVMDDGSFEMNMDYFDYPAGLRMTNARFDRLLGRKPRLPESEITRSDMDLAASVQTVAEEIVLKIAAHAARVTGSGNLVMAGGVALNCVANGRIMREGPFEKIWIQPAAGDAGGAIGAALAAWHIHQGMPREVDGVHDRMNGALLGPSFTDSEVEGRLVRMGVDVGSIEDGDTLLNRTAALLREGKTIGWFQDRMEFGPRALGGRSILGDARSPEMQRKLNLKVKKRESFRPFAPAVLSECAGEYFERGSDSPYMLLVDHVKKNRRLAAEAGARNDDWVSKINLPRSDIPAVTHVDYSARVQTVPREPRTMFRKLLEKFREITGYGILINTSFNVRGEPIVCTPEDAYRCFMGTDLDYLVIGNRVIKKGPPNQ